MLPKLLREYDSEYHYLFHLILKFQQGPYDSEYLYLMPNAMRKVLDIFLAFKSPGGQGLAGKIEQVINSEPRIDPDRVRALDRLVQVESHADSLDNLLMLSPLTIEETTASAEALLMLVETLDTAHYQSMCRLCRPESPSALAKSASSGPN